MFPVGEFSKITSLSVKALHLYHEKGLLVPSYVDEESGYRYYGQKEFEKALVIGYLKGMGFSLSDIKEMTDLYCDDSEIIDYLERRKKVLNEQMKAMGDTVRTLDSIIRYEKEIAMKLQNNDFAVEEKDVPDILIAAIRYRGRYQDCGNQFGRIGKALGRYICGKPFNLYYDDDYKEDDADIESCFPIRKGKEQDDIAVRELKGGRCLSLIHKGPYDDIGRSYKKIFEFKQSRGIEIEPPIRENYLKGPGMIFKGNPQNYLTEIQLMIRK